MEQEKIFSIGNHIFVSFNILDINNCENFQIEAPDGYECVGISHYKDGLKLVQLITWRNNKVVICKKSNEEKEYNKFGEPISKKYNIKKLSLGI